MSSAYSLAAIPSTIKLSMLNSGLLSFGKLLLFFLFSTEKYSTGGFPYLLLLTYACVYIDSSMPYYAIPVEPTNISEFLRLCEQRRKFPILYKLEFQAASKVESNSCKYANKRENLEKNQNQKCIAYDYNR